MVQVGSLDLFKNDKLLGGQKADILLVGLEENPSTQG